MADDREMSETIERTGGLTSGLAALVLAGLLALSGCSHEASVFSGLKPETPPALRGDCAPVTSRQPTLRWQAFPAAREAAENAPGVSDITYELKIWAADHDAPGELVYAREGLSEPSHTVQDPLSTDTSYFWSVRARFLLNGVAPRVTDWGQQFTGTIREAKSGDLIDHQYYRYYCFQVSREAK